MKKQIQHVGIIIIIAFIVASVWHFFMGQTGVWNQHKLSQRIAELETEQDSLKSEIQKQDFEAMRLLTDTFYIETLARTRYGMSRENEKAYYFVPDQAQK